MTYLEISLSFIFAAIKMVEATTSYFEKMSEELEKIVNEVKNSPTEENKTFTDSVQPTDTEASEYCIVCSYAGYKTNILMTFL